MMATVDPSKNHTLLECVGALTCGLGAGLAGYSVLVKLAAVPCFSSTCGAVINSEYGVLLGIPVGLYGLVVWGLLPWMPRWVRIGLKAVLVGGSIAFVLIQGMVLDQFCPICMAHALVCFGVAPLPIPSRKASVAVYGGLVLALTVAVWADAANRRSLRERMPVSTVTADDRGEAGAGLGLPWLSHASTEGVDLVISLSCGQCQRILEQLLAERSEGGSAPRILFYTGDGNTAVTRLVVAAVLSVDARNAPDAFARALVALLEDSSILARDDVDTARFLLAGGFPGMESALDKADAVLNAHDVLLQRLDIATTPALVVGGQPAPFDWDLVRE